MTQALAMNRTHSRRGFLAVVADLMSLATPPGPRPASRAATAVRPFDRELRLDAPFALLASGPR